MDVRISGTKLRVNCHAKNGLGGPFLAAKYEPGCHNWSPLRGECMAIIWRAKGVLKQEGGSSYCRACPYVVYICVCVSHVHNPEIRVGSARKILRTRLKKGNDRLGKLTIRSLD